MVVVLPLASAGMVVMVVEGNKLEFDEGAGPPGGVVEELSTETIEPDKAEMV